MAAASSRRRRGADSSRPMRRATMAGGVGRGLSQLARRAPARSSGSAARRRSAADGPESALDASAAAAAVPATKVNTSPPAPSA